MKKHFEILDLEEGASQAEIKAAYNSLSKKLNPANNDNQDFFKEEYKKVQAAYKAYRDIGTKMVNYIPK